MAIRLATSARNAAADAIADSVDIGSGAGTVKIYTAPRPATANTAPSGTLLATFTLNDPSFGIASSGSAALVVSPTVSTTGVADGDAAWFRLADSTGATVLDGSVSASGGSGDLIMSTITVSTGLTLNLSSGSITMPAA